MKLFILILAMLFSVSSFAEDARFSFSDPEQVERFRELTEKLRCLVCQNQSLADSDAPLANDLRRKVFGMMNDDMTNDEIIEGLVAVYGEYVLYEPRMTPQNYILWFTPAVFLLIGLVTSIIMVRRRESTVQVNQNNLAKAKELLKDET